MIRSKQAGWVGIGGALLVIGGAALAPSAAWAGSEGSRNTAIALGAAGLYEYLHGKKTEAVVLAAGAAVALKQSEDARRAESRRANRGRYYRTDDPNNPYHRSNNQYDQYGNNQYQDNQYRNGSDQDYETVPQDNGYHYGQHDQSPAWQHGRPNRRPDNSRGDRQRQHQDRRDQNDIDNDDQR